MTKELAVDGKVKLGSITSSPGDNLQSSADMSRADDPLVVNITRSAANLFFNHSLHFLQKMPSPHMVPDLTASSI